MRSVEPARTSSGDNQAVLCARDCAFGYGGVPVVSGLDLAVRPGEVTAVLGPNGSGKTTALLGLAGALRPLGGELEWLGRPVRSTLHRRAREGLAFISDERSVIFGLTVQENLRLGGVSLDVAFELFPELEKLGRRKVGLLSGGEQQILTMARALSRNPKLILIDELSLGLAPIVVDRLLAAISDAASRGISVVLVEQHVRSALQVANSAIVLARGEVALRGEASSLLDRLDEIEGTYFGTADVEAGSGAPS